MIDNIKNQLKIALGISVLPSISFDGVNDNLFSTSIVPLPAGDKNYTLVVVWRALRLSSADGIIVFGQGANPFGPSQEA